MAEQFIFPHCGTNTLLTLAVTLQGKGDAASVAALFDKKFTERTGGCTIKKTCGQTISDFAALDVAAELDLQGGEVRGHSKNIYARR